jgi:hypothetical protein
MDGDGWMRVAPEEIARMGYPKWIRERVDPLRVLSLDVKGAPKASRRNPPPGAEPTSGMGAAGSGMGAAALDDAATGSAELAGQEPATGTTE